MALTVSMLHFTISFQNSIEILEINSTLLLSVAPEMLNGIVDS